MPEQLIAPLQVLSGKQGRPSLPLVGALLSLMLSLSPQCTVHGQSEYPCDGPGSDLRMLRSAVLVTVLGGVFKMDVAGRRGRAAARQPGYSRRAPLTGAHTARAGTTSGSRSAPTSSLDSLARCFQFLSPLIEQATTDLLWPIMRLGLKSGLVHESAWGRVLGMEMRNVLDPPLVIALAALRRDRRYCAPSRRGRDVLGGMLAKSGARERRAPDHHRAVHHGRGAGGGAVTGIPDTIDPTGTLPVDATAAGPRPLMRLSRRKYNNTVHDLLGDDTRPADTFADDKQGEFLYTRSDLVSTTTPSCCRAPPNRWPRPP